MICEAHVGVAVKNVTVLSRTIFSCMGDKLAQIFFIRRIVGLCRSV